jgi:hypothetical protein
MRATPPEPAGRARARELTLWLARWLDATAARLATLSIWLRQRSDRVAMAPRHPRATWARVWQPGGSRHAVAGALGPSECLQSRAYVLIAPALLIVVAAAVGSLIVVPGAATRDAAAEAKAAAVQPRQSTATIRRSPFSAQRFEVSARGPRLLAREFTTLRAPVSEFRPHETSAAAAETHAIQRVLNKYRDAFSILDVDAVKSVWPAADTKTLGAAFSRIAHQNYDYDGCRIAVADTRAAASCLGVAEYSRVGSTRSRTERREWHFTLRNVGQLWVIDTAVAR